MADIFSKKKRSEIMSKIGSKDSRQEIFVRKLAHSLGYRFRLHRKDLPGKPDLVFPKYKKVIFVNGCFWHGHKGCGRSKLPETNKNFWKEKIEKNLKNDVKSYKKLNSLGWNHLVVWQCEIKVKNIDSLKDKINVLLSSENKVGLNEATKESVGRSGVVTIFTKNSAKNGTEKNLCESVA